MGIPASRSSPISDLNFWILEVTEFVETDLLHLNFFPFLTFCAQITVSRSRLTNNMMPLD